MTKIALLSLLMTGLALGCTQQSTEQAEVTETAAAATTTAEKGGHEGHNHAEGAGCSECDQATGKILFPDITTRKGPTGEEITHAGKELAGADVVSVAALLAEPDKWVGKTVKISGNVSAMCKHKRAWFAVVADDQSGDHVRIFTAPNFLVPHDSIGRSAVAEGSVEVIEIPVERARHMAGQHKLGEPEDITEPVKRVLIRATGADFS